MFKINIQNFQSLKDTSLVVNGLTAITGPNNSGKTALMRAVRAVFQNTPGNSFIRSGETTTQVDVEFPDNKITWKKSLDKKIKTQYIFNDGEPIFPGREIPEEVHNIGIKPVYLAGDAVWPSIANQFTGQIFLLDKPGSVLAEAVSDVERVTALNDALRKAESDKRATKSKLDSKRDELCSLQVEVAQYKGIEEVLSDLEDLQKMDKEIQNRKSTISKLEDLNKKYINLKSAVKEVPHLDLDTNLYQTIQKLSDLVKLQKSFPQVKEWSNPSEDLSMQNIDDLRSRINSFATLYKSLALQQTKINDLTLDLSNKQKEFDKVSLEMQSLLQDNGSCPLCGTNI